MPRMTPSQVAANWKKSLGAAGEKIKAAVAAVTESPMEKAANAQDLCRQNWLAAMDSNRWAQSLRGTPLPVWKTAMTGKGIQNMQAGLQEGESKVVQYHTLAGPTFDQISRDAASIQKDGTDATALRKVAIAIAGMRTLKGRMKNR